MTALALALTLISGASTLDAYYAHPRVEDPHGVIAPWRQAPNGPLDERVRFAIEVYKRYPWVTADKAVMTAPHFIYNSHWRISNEGNIEIPLTNDWMCGDLSQRVWSIVKGLVDYYRYSGDPIAFVYVTCAVDYVLDFGLTGSDHEWPLFPISTPTRGKAYGVCDPEGRIQLDLCARLGEDVLKAYKFTGDARYYEFAKHWADVFSKKCNFDPEYPPWNRYVDPSAAEWSDKLTGSTTMILEFLDEMIASGYTGENRGLIKARDAGRAFVNEQLLPRWTVNDVWGRQYWDWDNPVMCGIVSMCADYLLKHREGFPNWRIDLRNILTLIFSRNGVDPVSMGDVYSGAWAFPESSTCCGASLSYNQYTAAPTFIRYGVVADDDRLREIGRRMMIMATYDSDADGVVKDGLLGDVVATGEWSNLAHPWPLCQVMEAMAWMPESFGPARENHIMRSTSIVTHARYADGRIDFQTFDAPPDTVTVLRLAYTPAQVTADEKTLNHRPALDGNGYTLDPVAEGDVIVSIRHDGATRVWLSGDDPQQVIAASECDRQGSWELRQEEEAPGGTAAVTVSPGAKLAFRFTGNQVRVVGRVDEAGGLADIVLDGRRQNTLIDCWSRTRRDQQILYARSGLQNSPHTLEIVARGKGNPLSSGSAVYIAGIQCSAEEAKPTWGAGGGPTNPQRMIFGYVARKDYVDSHGNAWRPATEFVIRCGYGEDSVAQSLWTDRRTMYIGNTADPELYRYGIHGKEFWVNLTVGPGVYRLVLHFASTPLHPVLEQDKEKGWLRHVLDVDINKERVISEMDVAEAAGGRFKALTRTFDDICPKNGVIEVKLNGCDGREAILQALEIIPLSK